MKGTGETVNSLQDREKLLQQELEVSGNKVTFLSEKLRTAKEIYGENSIEASNWSAKLADAKRVQESIAQELTATSAKLREQKEAEGELGEEAKRAADKLKAQAEAEEQLKGNLGQVDSQLKTFDQELQLNATKLDGVKDKTELLKERQTLLAGQSQVAAQKTQILENALETCAREVGVNSDEYTELKSKLIEAQTQEASIQNEIKNTTKELKEQKTAIQTFGEGLGTFGEGVEKVGQGLKTASASAAGALTGTSVAAISFESAFAGVKKTSDEVFDANGKCVYSYKQLEDGIRNMAKEIPASTTEISEVAESAGQLGIKTQDVLAFTRVMIDMGNSTNLSADDAATSIAKFANITGLAADASMSAEEKYQKMGSTIVDLGNHYATTESDIMNMAMNLASAGTQVGMSESDILALATALSSVGMEAQAGGTAFSKALVNMQLAVETNSESLKDWADVAGMSVDEFSTLFKENATGALEAFIKGLSKCGGETDSAIKVLDDMGITETRMRDALLRSANASDVFSSAIQTGKDAWKENSALTEEANKRYETTASKLQIMKNNIYDVGITLGSTFLPMIQKASEKLVEITNKISEMDGSQQKMLLGIAAFVAILSPVLIGIGKVSTGISSIIGVGSKLSGMFAGAGAAAEGAGVAMSGGITAVLGPAVIVIATIAAVGATLVTLWKKSEEFRDFVTGAVGTIKDTISGFLENIGIEEKIDNIKNAFSGLSGKLTGLTNLFKAIGTIVGTVVVAAIGVLSVAFNTLLSVVQPFCEILGGVIDVLSGLGDMIVGVFTGDTDLAKQGMDLFSQGVKEIFSGIKDFIAGVFSGIVEGVVSFGKSIISALGLEGAVASVKNAFENIKNTVSNAIETVKNVITVGVMLIGEIFNAAFQIITLPFQFIWQNCKDTVISVWNVISTRIQSVISVISGVVQRGFQLINTHIVTPIRQAYSSVSSAFSSIYSAISSRISTIKSVVQSGFQTVYNRIITPIRQAYSSVSSTFSSIYNAISSKINAAKDAVGNAISRMKSFFNFSWSLPHLKMPHFSITGSFSLKPPRVPHFSVSWYAKGAVFSQPTILPTYEGWKGVGEAGEEAVAPIAILRGYIAEEMERVVSRIQIADRDPIDYDRLASEMAKRKVTVEYKGREFGRVIEEVMA